MTSGYPGQARRKRYVCPGHDRRFLIGTVIGGLAVGALFIGSPAARASN
jgi:hypothetical protein